MPAGRILLKSISESKKLAALKTDGARLLYTWLIPHVDVNGCFSGDVEVIKGQIFTRLKKSDREIESFLSDLEDVGLIVRYEAEGDLFIFLPTFEEKQPHLNKDREATPRIPLPSPDQLKTKSGPNPDKIPLKYKYKVKVKENVEILPSVIEYLNQKTGKKFSPTSSAAVRHISARIAEGRTLEDFKRVVDIKVAKWGGDPKMDDYLRPETLFGTKMESYLNESTIPTPEQREARVGAQPETSPEEKNAAQEKARRVKEFVRQMETKWDPLIEAAKTPEERTKLRDAANAETQVGIKKIHGYEARA